ncbi:MAG: hypothetical protein HUJ26_23640 [Planctomycetaceae bacterium]|nr:hypothetical protein [Planctomycetaceae bacterium]
MPLTDSTATSPPRRRCFPLMATLMVFLWTPAVGLGGEPEVRITHSGSWTIAESENFRLVAQNSRIPLREVAEQCETLKTTLQKKWLGQSSNRPWLPVCEITFCSTLRDYHRALGSGVGTSVGCATINYDQGRVTQRQIHIRLDHEDWLTDALPHELTHVIVADRFTENRIPPWLDEGIGVLSESDEKQQERFKALQASLRRGHKYSWEDLFRVRSFPPANYRNAFYGQSARLVDYLSRQGKSPSHLLEFAQHAEEHGYQAAYQKYYASEESANLSAPLENHLPHNVILGMSQERDQSSLVD